MNSLPSQVQIGQQARPVLRLTVSSGPDAGKTRSFDQDTVVVGRDLSSDFALRDRYVSNRHGVLSRTAAGFTYRDLASRHGSLVVIDDVSVRLHDSTERPAVEVSDGAEVQIGSSVIKLEITRAPESAAHVEFASTVKMGPDGRDQYITSAHMPVAALTRRFTGKDPRLEILFKLAGQLNALNRLDDILDLIVEATFQAFPAVNHFSMSLLHDGQLKHYITKMREGINDDGAPILSQSILEQVVATQESLLFVRDELGAEVSKSIIEAKITACLAAPLVGQHSLLGVMQVDTRSRGRLFSHEDLDLFSVLASNVAFALERARLSESIYTMFESFVTASVGAVEARDPTTAGHSQRVADYSIILAETVNEIRVGTFGGLHFPDQQLTELRYAALLHDFGKVAVREAVLMKSGRLSDARMAVIGARLATFKEVYWRELAGGLFERLLGQGQSPRPADLEALNTEHGRFCRELDEVGAFLEHARHIRSLSDDDQRRIAELAGRTVMGPGEVRVPLLEDADIENLTVRNGMLNRAEWRDIQSHPAHSEAYLEQIPWSDDLKQVPCIAGAHHEKLDGSGYPRGLVAADIIPQVRILSIADIFDAVTAWDRPYRKACTVTEACDILAKEAEAAKLDGELVDIFLHACLDRIVPLIPQQ